MQLSIYIVIGDDHGELALIIHQVEDVKAHAKRA